MASVNGIHTGEPDPVEDPGHQLEGPLDMLDLSPDQHMYVYIYIYMLMYMYIYIYIGVVCGHDVVYATTQTDCCWMTQTDGGRYTMLDASSDPDQPVLSECGWLDLPPHDVP